jgi:glutaconate CoA-transferase, subunit B
VSPDDYSLAEMMCVAAARALPETGTALLGMGPPLLAGTLAKLLQRPGLIVCTEVGAIDWDPDPDQVDRAPYGVSDNNLHLGLAMASDMVDGLGTLLMGGNVDVGVLQAAQIDRFGNLNTLLLGSYQQPARRLGGTGGNTEIACLARSLIALMPQEPRRWVERVDFNTSPGYRDGPGGRQRAGLDTQGPNTLISTMGVFGYDTPDGGASGSCEVRLDAVFPGVDPETIAALVPWPLRMAETITELPPPTTAELTLLRRLDRLGMYLAPGRY